mmetsp:Transcript_7127/g.16853  ORF Transcript_7127/g.16853 Transcript_7127/m.16853 type:complete len:416 (-) Transcript_7127:84-1331(-)
MNFRPFPAFKGAGGKGGKGYEEEDRSRDWYCNKCRERNFVKRAECFKCKTPKPKDVDCSAPPRPVVPQSGTTLNGMVKSYNRKGFGFLMCFGIEHCQDIHYTRENLSPKLQTRDIPGQHVTFEIHRSPDGKLTALNIRPIGEEPETTPCVKGKAGGKGLGFLAKAGGREEEDRSRDWLCSSCGERNFVKRFECFKCKALIPIATRTTGFSEAPGGEAAAATEPRRTVSPHAGSRAWRELYAATGGGGAGASSRSRGRARKRRRKRRRSRSDSSRGSSSSSSTGKRKAKKKKRRRRSKSRSSCATDPSISSGSKSSDCKMEADGHGTAGRAGQGEAVAAVAALRSQCNGSLEIEKAKAEALEELMKLRTLDTKEARMTEFRALLRKWHPDKNPERVEVATAVFQFLQKGKPVLEGK